MATEITIKGVEGNPLAINVVMIAIEHSMLNGEMVTETVDFYPDTTKPVRAVLDCTTARRQYCPQTSVTDNVVYVSDNGSIAAGVYTLTITCTDTQGKKRRYKSDPCIEVYDATSAAEIAATFDSQTYEINGVFYTFGGGGATVQSDWDESNPESPAYIRNKPNLSDYATDEELQAVADTFNDSAAAQITDGDIENWNNKSDFSGSYNDLSDKPTIPPAQVQSDWNQTNTSAKDYIKNKPTIPQGVVVDSALSSTSENPVQNKVINNALNGKQATIADLNDIRNGAAAGATAYQKPSAGIPKSDLAQDVQTSLGLADTALQSYTETDPVFSASPAAGITSSDITEWDGKADPTPVVNHGTSDTTFALTPNVLHIWGEVTSLTLTLATPTDATIVNEYMFQFTSGSTATTLSLPSTVVWDEDKGALTVESGYIYQVSILNNIALWARVAV